jgi:hypothetical protein|nr:MAG TPA: hypothetical protein [Caudoviricetes sp.]
MHNAITLYRCGYTALFQARYLFVAAGKRQSFNPIPL